MDVKKGETKNLGNRIYLFVEPLNQFETVWKAIHLKSSSQVVVKFERENYAECEWKRVKCRYRKGKKEMKEKEGKKSTKEKGRKRENPKEKIKSIFPIQSLFFLSGPFLLRYHSAGELSPSSSTFISFPSSLPLSSSPSSPLLSPSHPYLFWVKDFCEGGPISDVMTILDRSLTGKKKKRKEKKET